MLRRCIAHCCVQSITKHGEAVFDADAVMLLRDVRLWAVLEQQEFDVVLTSQSASLSWLSITNPVSHFHNLECKPQIDTCKHH